MARRNFIEGAAVLAVAGLLTKLLGAVYRIPLSRMMGSEGLGLFQMAYPLYAVMLAVSIAGVPTAISKLIAEKIAVHDFAGVRRVFRVSLWLLITTGAFFSVLLFSGAEVVSTRVLGDARAYLAIRAIAPAVFVVAVVAAFRGYFQGMQNMIPTAVSQIVEQMVRIGTMLSLVHSLLPKGIEFAAAGASFGAVTGGLASLIILAALYHFHHRKEAIRFSWAPGPFRRNAGTRKTNLPGVKTRSAPSARSHKRATQETNLEILRRIIHLAIPITLGSLIMPAIEAITAAIVPSQLQVAGLSVREATDQYGLLAGMAFSVMAFPTVVMAALGTSLVPAISEANALHNKRLVIFRTGEAVRLTILFSLPAAAGLFILATPICSLLFGYPEAGIPLTYLAFGTLFLSLQESTSGILQGLGRTAIPVKSMLVGATVNAACAYLLTPIPGVGIKGAALGATLGFAVSAYLNLRSLNNMGLLYLPWRTLLLDIFLKPGGAVLGMSWIVMKTYALLYDVSEAFFSKPSAGNAIGTLAAIGLGAVAYGTALIVLKAVKPEELGRLPLVGGSLARICRVFYPPAEN